MTEDIVEQIKARIRIEDVVVQDGYPLPTRGRYRKCTKPGTGGLVVDVQKQTYHWNARGEWGDVLAWYEKQHRVDFKTACEELARLAHLDPPVWSRQNETARAATRSRTDAMTAAATVFHRWLMKSERARTYIEARGWTIYQVDEDGEQTAGTALQAYLGYTGSGSDDEHRELRGELLAAGVDLDSAVAVSILGWQGDVKRWAADHEVEIQHDDWIARGKIPGIWGRDGVVYTHTSNGRVVYLTYRSIEGKQHYNLPAELVGPRQVYLNQVYVPDDDEVVLVEGQADAISLGQWGISAIALAGVTPGDNLVEMLDKHKSIYVATDADTTGLNAAWRLCKMLGPNTRLLPWTDLDDVDCKTPEKANSKQRETTEMANQIARAVSGVMHWPVPDKLKAYEKNGELVDVKDANDLLRSMAQANVIPDLQVRTVRALMDKAPTYVEAIASWAGAREGAVKDEAIKQAVAVIGQLDEFGQSQHKSRLAKLLQVTIRDLDRMVKALNAVVEKARMGESVYTWGGFIDGYLIEYLYDPATEHALLAWRDPDGKISSGNGVEVGGKYYQPFDPNDQVRTGHILFPSAVGDKKTIGELATYIKMYLNSVYIMPSDKLTKLVAYWVIQTYLFDAFNSTMYLRAVGDKGAGKSEFIYRVGYLCHRMMSASGADSTASLFRSVHRYHGTVLIDEADTQYSDTEAEIIKFYNQGAFKGRPIMRTREVTLEDGSKDWEAVTFDVYCPKLIGMRKDFKDDAVGSRSLTLKLTSREMTELIDAGIPLAVDSNILAKAAALRNLLIRFRLETWQPEIAIDPTWYDKSISARLNQVAGPLLAIAKDDPYQQEDIRETLRDYYQETIISQSMTLAARVIEAIWKIWNYPDLHQACVKLDEEGVNLIKIGDITRITNQIINEMNDEEEEDEDEEHSKFTKRKELKSQRVGRIIREELQFQVTERRRDGFWMIWNQPRLVGLSTKFGVNPKDFGPKEEEPKPPTLAQGNLAGV
jgi:5S rRNA maturation endonuclease (ribonuclease M5)